jgi:hypothetical protein
MSVSLHPGVVRTSAALRGRGAAPRAELLGLKGRAVNPIAAFFGTRRTPRPTRVCPRRRTCAGGECYERGQRRVSAPGLLGFALVRSSPIPNFRSHDGSTLADGDESAMKPGQKIIHPSAWKRNSAKSISRILHSPGPMRPEIADSPGRVCNPTAGCADTDPRTPCKHSRSS